jgi:hypothetical protein
MTRCVSWVPFRASLLAGSDVSVRGGLEGLVFVVGLGGWFFADLNQEGLFCVVPVLHPAQVDVAKAGVISVLDDEHRQVGVYCGFGGLDFVGVRRTGSIRVGVVVDDAVLVEIVVIHPTGVEKGNREAFVVEGRVVSRSR